ncbi:hypothetical protein, partial [Desulfosarcina cetonica]|uniref:hypothetical protein n=1 Tax=Desulfosarcina cetonica TaxID=90730 RepID=UPI0012EDDFEE
MKPFLSSVFLALTILSFFIPSLGFADVFYVNTIGDDGNDGTSADDSHAWKTIGKAWNSINDGGKHIVYVSSGQYFDEGRTYHFPQTNGSTIVFRAQDGPVHIRSSNLNPFGYVLRPIGDCTMFFLGDFIFDQQWLGDGSINDGNIYFIASVVESNQNFTFD